MKDAEEEIKQLKNIIYWLADCYQVNFEKFSPNFGDWDKKPAYIKKAYEQFATVQGFSLRQLVEKLAKKEIDHKAWQEGIELLKSTE